MKEQTKQKLKERVELHGPWAGGLVAVWGYTSLCGFTDAPVVPKHLTELAGAVVSISSIAIGFLATVKSVLASLVSTRTVKYLREANKWPLLINYIMDSIRFCAGTALIGVVFLVVEFRPRSAAQLVFLGIWLGLSVIAGLTAYRVVWFMTTILRDVGEDADVPPTPGRATLDELDEEVIEVGAGPAASPGVQREDSQ